MTLRLQLIYWTNGLQGDNRIDITLGLLWRLLDYCQENQKTLRFLESFKKNMINCIETFKRPKRAILETPLHAAKPVTSGHAL